MSCEVREKPTLGRIARRLNSQHARTLAGFYASTGGRFMAARVRKGALVVRAVDGSGWQMVDIEATSFRDHVGREIFV